MATEELSGILDDPLADSLGYQLRRASLVYLTHLTDIVEALDLRLTEATFLMFVAANPGCNQGEISRALGVKRTNMVPTVNELVKKGLVAREAADGRTNALSLTAAGVKLHAELSEQFEQCDRKFFGDIEPESLKLLEKALHEIRKKSDE